MEVVEKDDKPNRMEHDASTFAFVNTLLQKSYNFNYQNDYDFADDDAKRIHDEKAKNIPRHMIRVREHLEPAKPFVSEIVCEDGKTAMQTLVSYKQYDVVLNCFGTLKIRDKTKVERHMFVTSTGLVLSAKDKGNLWRFVKESCKPNCKFGECFIWNVENETSSYFCWLEATRNIKVGEKLTVESNQMRGLGVTGYNCNCKEVGCVQYQKRKHTCRVPDCSLRGQDFGNAKLLQKHMEASHPKPSPVKLLEMIAAKKYGATKKKADGAKKAPKKANDGEKLKCPEKDCEQILSSRQILQRHLRGVHGHSSLKHICEICDTEFFRADHLRRHIFNRVCLKPKKGKTGEAKNDEKESGRKASPPPKPKEVKSAAPAKKEDKKKAPPPPKPKEVETAVPAKKADKKKAPPPPKPKEVKSAAPAKKEDKKKAPPPKPKEAKSAAPAKNEDSNETERPKPKKLKTASPGTTVDISKAAPKKKVDLKMVTPTKGFFVPPSQDLLKWGIGIPPSKGEKNKDEGNKKEDFKTAVFSKTVLVHRFLAIDPKKGKKKEDYAKKTYKEGNTTKAIPEEVEESEGVDSPMPNDSPGTAEDIKKAAHEKKAELKMNTPVQRNHNHHTKELVDFIMLARQAKVMRLQERERMKDSPEKAGKEGTGKDSPDKDENEENANPRKRKRDDTE